MPDAGPPSPRLPPRWFIRGFWVAHRAVYRVTGGRLGLWRSRPTRWGTMRITTTGRRTGRERNAIIAYFEDGPNVVAMAMNGWADPDPAWWLNLQAHPEAVIRLPAGPREVIARRATGEERERLWARWAALDKGLDGYAARRSRETAVVVLEPLKASDRRGGQGGAGQLLTDERSQTAMTHHRERRGGRAEIVELTDGDRPRYAARLTPAGGQALTGPVTESVEEAVAWARARTDTIIVRLAFRAAYSAGEARVPDHPRWPPPPDVVHAIRHEQRLWYRAGDHPAARAHDLELHRRIQRSILAHPDVVEDIPSGAWTAYHPYGVNVAAVRPRGHGIVHISGRPQAPSEPFGHHPGHRGGFRYSTRWEPGSEFATETWSTFRLEDSIAWARERAPRVVVYPARRGAYSAGTEAVPGLPTWPPPVEVRRAIDLEEEALVPERRAPDEPTSVGAGVRRARASMARQPDPRNAGGVAMTRVHLGEGLVHLVEGGGSLWAGYLRTGQVHRVDPVPGRESGVVSLNDGIRAVAFADRRLWIVTGVEVERLRRVDAATMRTLADADLGLRPGAIVNSMLPAFGALWVTVNRQADNLLRVDPVRGHVEAATAVDARYAMRMASGFGALWIIDRAAPAVVRYDPDAGGRGERIALDHIAFDICVGDSAIWAVSESPGVLTRVDPHEGRITATLDLGGTPVGVCAGGGLIWVSDAERGAVQRIDPLTGTPVGGRIYAAASPGGPVWTGDAVWVGDRDDGSITRIRPELLPLP